jgi:hypothetical protein
MPAAVGFIGAALAGGLAGFGAAGGTAAALGTAILGTVIGASISMGLYGLQMVLGSGESNMSNPSQVSLADTGLRFDPTPNFTSSQQVIPLVFGKTSVAPQIAHKRAYYTDYQRGYFFLACGEGPMDLEKILIDDVDMTELPNYSASPGESNKSWYKWHPLGSKYTMTLNNSGNFAWGSSEAKWFPYSYTAPPADDADFGHIAGPLCMIYGGGSIRCYFKFSQSQSDAGTWVRFRIENYYSPSEFYVSNTSSKWAITNASGKNTVYAFHGNGWYGMVCDSSMPVAGGYVETTTGVDGYYTFENLDPMTVWKVTLEYNILSAQYNMAAQVTFDKVVITDSDKTEDFACWGTAYAVVHLAWHETLSSNPQFSAIVKGFGREQGEDEGNPALCAYFLLTDREYPDSEPFDILLDRADPLMVDYESVQETMQFCNDLNDGAGYRFNRAYGAMIEKEKALKEMMAAGRFFIYQLANGTYFFKPDRDEPLTRVISEAMEVVPGSIQYQIKDYDSPNIVRCSYYDAGLGYTVQTLPIELNDERPRLKPETIDLTGVTDQHQAYELGRYALLSRQLLQYPVSLDVRYHTVLTCYLGDIVEIDTTDPILTGRKFRIMGIPEEKPGYIYTLQLTEHSPDIYTSKIDGVEENGYESFTPWYHIPIESSSPSSWPGGNLGPSQVINLDITRVDYQADTSITTIKIEYEYLPANADKIKIEYSTDDGQTWTVAGYSYSNTYTLDVDLRWGVVRVRVASVWKEEVGVYSTVEEYLTGLGGDDAGIGRAQIGWSPIGGDTL